MAQEGFEPSASLVLNESGLPVAWTGPMAQPWDSNPQRIPAARSRDGSPIRPVASVPHRSSGGWNRTSGLHVQSVASRPTSNCPGSCVHIRTRIAASGSGRRIRTSIAWFKARQPAVSRSPRVPRGSRTRLSSLEDWCLPLGQGHDRRSRAEGEGVEPSRLIARTVFESAADRRIRLALRIRSCGGRNRTCELLSLTVSVACTSYMLPPESIQSGRPDLNRRSPGPEAGGFPGFPTPRTMKCPAGVEPALPPWQGSRLPLHHGHI